MSEETMKYDESDQALPDSLQEPEPYKPCLLYTSDAADD